MFELNHLYNMDCMEAMKSIPDHFFDLAICDPPYGINAPGMSMGSNRSRTKEKGGYPHESTADRMRKERGAEAWDTERPGPAYFRELFRISKNQVIFGYNYFSDLLPPTRCVIVWDKVQPWEAFSQAEIAWSSFDRPAILIKISNTGGGTTPQRRYTRHKSLFPSMKRSYTSYQNRGRKLLIHTPEAVPWPWRQTIRAGTGLPLRSTRQPLRMPPPG